MSVLHLRQVRETSLINRRQVRANRWFPIAGAVPRPPVAAQTGFFSILAVSDPTRPPVDRIIGATALLERLSLCLLRTMRSVSPRYFARSGDRSFTIRPATAKFSAKPQAEEAEILPAFSEFQVSMTPTTFVLGLHRYLGVVIVIRGRSPLNPSQ